MLTILGRQWITTVQEENTPMIIQRNKTTLQEDEANLCHTLAQACMTQLTRPLNPEQLGNSLMTQKQRNSPNTEDLQQHVITYQKELQPATTEAKIHPFKQGLS